jgi:SAM-dependent methyltransferase
MYRPFFHLTESLRQGRNIGLCDFPGPGDTLYERLSDYPELAHTFYGWMQSLDPTGVPKPVITALRDSRHVVDAGGGSASVAIQLAHQLADLRVTIFDIPTARGLAERNVDQAGLSNRIQFLPGNFLNDPLVGDMDSILFAHIFNIYSADTNQMLIQKCADRLPKGGKLVIYNIVSDDNGAGPLDAAFLSLYFHVLATGQGMVYPPKRYEAWFRNAGFESLVIEMETYQGIFIGTK